MYNTTSPTAAPPPLTYYSPPAPGPIPNNIVAEQPALPPLPSEDLPLSKKGDQLAVGALAGIVIGILVGILVAVTIFAIFYKRKKRELAGKNLPPQELKSSPDDEESPRPMLRNPSLPVPGSPSSKTFSNSRGTVSDKPFVPPSPRSSLGSYKSTFTYEELKNATDNFSDANLLGQGGFGFVYRGILADGKMVAIKQLKAASVQGEREFQAEIEIISRVHHRHLVSLVGYCVSGTQRLLVYEFVPNKTLEFHLHGKDAPAMNWPTRMKIALGSAKGLAYLHEDCHPKIIHRDIKSANILLDNKFEAKVADFGLAKFSLDTDTHVSTRIMGTFGYLAPEYASSGKLTEKSDVFSYGVLLLELITGLRPSDKIASSVDDSMVDQARRLLNQALKDDKFDALADPKLQEYDSAEMVRMATCAAVCIRHSARLRPRMSQIVRALEGLMPLDDLNEGVKPGHSAVDGFSGGQNYNSMQYREDMKKFREMVLESREHGSSDYSGVTSDYGHNPSSSEY